MRDIPILPGRYNALIFRIPGARPQSRPVFVHDRNRGYGANQKTCYREALAMGADIVVMVHPDYQYDARVIPALVAPILAGRADAAFASRMLGGDPLRGGMPWWKYIANILLTAAANIVFQRYLTEIHSGFRAYSRRYLGAVRFEQNSDDFVFDTEIIAQGMACGLTFQEAPIVTRYFPEASSISFRRSVRYGLGILGVLVRHLFHTTRLWHGSQFDPCGVSSAARSLPGALRRALRRGQGLLLRRRRADED